MLHIHNGDCSAEIAKQSTMPGEHFAWREALVDGPTPAGLTAEEWRKVRAQHLSETYEVDATDCEEELEAGENKLATCDEHDELVLWFEHDLFCQVNLIYLLQWFGYRKVGKTKLSLICVGEFPGKDRFRGLGELNAVELQSLFPSRRPITQQQFALADVAWRAYCSRDPTDVQSLVSKDTSPLPFLNAAMKAHLKRFPSTRNGLGRVENDVLQVVAEGAKTFKELFNRFAELEPIYGFGDAQLWNSLRRLADVGQPLLKVNATNPRGTVEPEAEIEIKDLGRAVLKGDGDFVMLNGIDRWLGGVYLEDERNIWRWDEKSEKLIFA